MKKTLFVILFCSFTTIFFAQKQNLKDYDYVNTRTQDSNNWLRSDIWSYVQLTKSTCALVDIDYDAYDRQFSDGDYEEDFYIPSYINGLTVTELSKYLFEWEPCEGNLNYHVKKIHIPDTVTFIQQGTFKYIDEGPREMEIVLDGNNIAYETYNRGLYSKKDNALITTFTIIKNRSDQTHFTTKDGTRIICEDAFNTLSVDRYIELSYGVITIEKSAFGNEYQRLTTEKCIFPETVRNIKTSIIPQNSEISSKNQIFLFYDDYVYNKQTKTISTIIDTNPERLTIADGVENIEGLNLYSTESLKEIVFPDSMKKIDIEEYYNLIEKNLPPNIEYLNISYPEGTVLPDSCKYYGASNLVQVNSTNPYLKIENDMMLSKDGKTLYHIYKIPDDGTLIIPDGIETIESNVLPYEINNLKEIVLPQNNINISADFLLFSNDNGVKINIPANARINNSNINYIYWINTNLSVDAKNPVLAEKNGYFYDKKENKVYYLRMEPSQTEIVIPQEFSDLSLFTYHCPNNKLKSLTILNPNTKFTKKYNFEGGDFELYVPKGSKIDNNLLASHIYYHTYIPNYTTDNLRLRTKPGTDEDSEIIATLPKGTAVRIISKKRDEIKIDGIKGQWSNVQILTPVYDQDGNQINAVNTLSGWCFDGYLTTKKPK